MTNPKHTSSDLVERLRKARVWPDYSQSRVTIETAHEAADLIETQAREIERLNEAMREAINTVSDLARKVGEAEGKLAISETAGVLDGWMAENARLLASVKAWAADAARHSDNADYWRQECQMLREALREVLDDDEAIMDVTWRERARSALTGETK